MGYLFLKSNLMDFQNIKDIEVLHAMEDQLKRPLKFPLSRLSDCFVLKYYGNF